MPISHLLLVIFSLQGYHCIRFIAQKDTDSCILEYKEDAGGEGVEISDSDVTRNCKYVSYGEGRGKLDYHYTQGMIYYIDPRSRVMKLQGYPMNSSAEEVSSSINIPPYARYKITDLAVDWIHDTCYLTCDNNLFFAPALVSKEEILISNITTPKEVGQILGKDETLIRIVSVKLDPYEQSLFILVQLRDEDVFYTYKTYIFRSDLMGKGLRILTQPVLTSLAYVPFNVDVGEKRLYIYRYSDLHMYDYEGNELGQFYMEYGENTASFNTLGNGLYLTSLAWPSIARANITLNVSQDQAQIPRERLKINKQIPHGMGIWGVVFKVLDARVQRRKQDGQYVCDRRDCPDLCEVWPSGDTCVCPKTKAKAIDGVTCYECGQSELTSLKVQPEIVNGTDALLGNFPWHAVIYNRTKHHICGGTLVSSRVVLTAAHCVANDDDMTLPTPVETADIFVALGKTRRDWNIREKSQQSRRVQQILLHDKYGGGILNVVHDIALLFLEYKVSTSNLVMPACLDYNLNQLPPHETLTGYVPGMGYTEECAWKECANMSETLKYVKVQVVTFANCFKNSLKIQRTTYYTLTPEKFCIGNGSESAVQEGDSGGGLTLEYRGLHYLTGVVSVKLLNTRGSKYSFGAFTNVSEHMDWLKQNLPKADLLPTKSRPKVTKSRPKITKKMPWLDCVIKVVH